MNQLKFNIPGKPIAKKRPRFFRRGNFTGTYNDQRTEEGRFLWEVQNQLPLGMNGPIIESEGHICMRVIFYMPIPKSTSKKKRQILLYHTKKPDLDNLVKFVKDCFNDVVWKDDSQVAELHAGKMYSEDTRTEITVTWHD